MEKIINKKIIILLSLLLFLPLFSGCFLTPFINQAPTITSTSITTATVDEPYTYDVNATDPDEDTLTYSLTTKPDGMTINPTTGVINWTPTSTQIGNNSVTVKAFDGALDDTQSFIIIVSEAEAPTYTVTFDSQGGSAISPVTGIAYNATITLPADPTLAGNAFGGWWTEAAGGGTEFTAATPVTANIAVYAKWTAADTYTVTFDSQGGSAISPVTGIAYNATITLPADPTLAGNAFAGWNTQADGGGTEFTATTEVTADITVYAQWTINAYTITYNGNGSTGGTVPVDSSSPYEYRATVTVLDNIGTLVNTGYTFAGWNTHADGNGIDRAVGSTFIIYVPNTILYAKWTAAAYTYTVTFNSNSGSAVSPVTGIAYNTTITLPAAPTKPLYTFAGWFSDDTTFLVPFTASTPVTASITVHAKWTADTYTVTFNSKGGSAVSPITGIAYNATITLPTAPTKALYTFAGWFSDDTTFLVPFTASTPVTANVTVYAQWTSSVHNITQNTYYAAIQAALDDANSDDTIEVDDGTYAESITFPNGEVITLRSLNGDSFTTIIGTGGSDTVIFNGSLTGTLLEGFTITHEAAMLGSGVSISNSNLTINECTISGNTTNTSGGGIYNDSVSTLTITSSTISGNTAADYGGGIYNDSVSTLTITSSTISGNTAANAGGGIANHIPGTLTITSSTISDNTATEYGGGIDNYYSTLTITSSTISDNIVSTVPGFGGGIDNYRGASTIISSTISGNNAIYGGGIYNYSVSSNLSIISSAISGNNVSQQGGGIYLADVLAGTITIGGIDASDTDNNTFTDNKLGGTISTLQHIRDSAGDVKTTYPYNVYNP